MARAKRRDARATKRVVHGRGVDGLLVAAPAQPSRRRGIVDGLTTCLVRRSELLTDQGERLAAHAGASHRLRWAAAPVLAATVALTLGLGGGAAYAYFTSLGSGTGHATTGSASVITVTAVASPGADANLYPGGPAVSVHFTVNNPNPYQVSFTGWSGATLSSVTPLGANTCTMGDFQISSASHTFSPTLTIAANTPSSPGVSGTANGIVQLKTTAQNGCQGATVTVSLTLSGGQSQ